MVPSLYVSIQPMVKMMKRVTWDLSILSYLLYDYILYS